MSVRVELQQSADRVIATCPDLPGCRAEGSTREEALDKIRGAIAYYREMCPCDVTAEAGLELDVVDAAHR